MKKFAEEFRKEFITKWNERGFMHPECIEEVEVNYSNLKFIDSDEQQEYSFKINNNSITFLRDCIRIERIIDQATTHYIDIKYFEPDCNPDKIVFIITSNNAIWLEEFHCLVEKSVDFSNYALPLIRKAYPAFVANELISIQPMNAPTSANAFYHRIVRKNL